MEENIWIIYLIIIFLSFYNNKIERHYYIYKDSSSKNNYRKFNILIFSIALVVYCYFFKSSYNSFEMLKQNGTKEQLFFNEASLMASTLILISGTILLYIAIFDVNLNTELAFS